MARLHICDLDGSRLLNVGCGLNLRWGIPFSHRYSVHTIEMTLWIESVLHHWFKAGYSWVILIPNLQKSLNALKRNDVVIIYIDCSVNNSVFTQVFVFLLFFYLPRRNQQIKKKKKNIFSVLLICSKHIRHWHDFSLGHSKAATVTKAKRKQKFNQTKAHYISIILLV